MQPQNHALTEVVCAIRFSLDIFFKVVKPDDGFDVKVETCRDLL
jgi:hypothetical protein